MSQPTLEQKQRHAIRLILEFALGSTAASSIPTPVFEVPKQFMLTVADLTLCWRLYALYYDEELSPDSLLALIRRAGIAPAAGVAVAYASARTAQGFADETQVRTARTVVRPVAAYDARFPARAVAAPRQM